LCAAYFCSDSIASAVELEWYLDVAKFAAGWNVGAVGLSELPVDSMVPSACGAMIDLFPVFISFQLCECVSLQSSGVSLVEVRDDERKRKREQRGEANLRLSFCKN